MAAMITGFSQAAIGQPGEVDSSQRNPLGKRAAGVDALGNDAEYIYLKGVGSVIVGSVVTYDEAGVTALLAANAVGPVAVATAIVDSTSEFGWFGIAGTFPTDVVANCADNAKLGRETSDGKVGDGFASGDAIYGAVSRNSTSAAAVINCQFMYASVNDSSA